MTGNEALRPLTQDDIVMRGEKVALRRKRFADAGKDYAWRADPELARYDAAPPLRIDFRDFLVIYAEDLERSNPLRYTYAIEDDGGRHIGNVMYYNVDRRKKQAELGITIGEREYWGKGYGTDAVRCLLRLVFATTELQRVYLHTLYWNERAQRAFEKAGFERCGRNRRDGYDFVVMETSRDSFLAGDALPRAAEQTALNGSSAD